MRRRQDFFGRWDEGEREVAPDVVVNCWRVLVDFFNYLLLELPFFEAIRLLLIAATEVFPSVVSIYVILLA